jgi:hypothetical protein
MLYTRYRVLYNDISGANIRLPRMGRVIIGNTGYHLAIIIIAI